MTGAGLVGEHRTLVRRSGVGVLAGVALLASANLANNLWLADAYVVTCVAATVGLVALSRRWGLAWHQIGLARNTLRRGLVWAVASVVAVACVYAVGLAIPATRAAFVDQRASNGLGGAVFQALVPVLLGTVLLEEVAFRGVIWGLLHRVHGPGWATAGSSALFGLWHLLPAVGIAGHNRAVGVIAGTGSGVAVPVVLSAVALAAVAGAILCELRRRTGSLVAGAGLHWATNGLGYVCASAAGTWA